MLNFSAGWGRGGSRCKLGLRTPVFPLLLFGSVVAALGAQPTLPTHPPGSSIPQLQEGVCVPTVGASAEEVFCMQGQVWTRPVRGTSVKGTPKAQAMSVWVSA